MKHSFLLLTASTLALGFAACGSSGNSTSSASATGTGGATTSSSTGATSSTSSSASSTTSSTSGTGGTGGMTSSSSTSSSSGSGGGCTWSANSNPCGPGKYCDSCGQGNCVDVPAVATEKPEKMVVCGCDGNQYWNASVAATHSMPLSGQMQCGKTCGGFGNLKCDQGLFCDYEGQDQNVCQIADQGGVCIGLQTTCGGVQGFGPQTRQCGSNTCEEECSLIKKGVTFYPDNSCPK